VGGGGILVPDQRLRTATPRVTAEKRACFPWVGNNENLMAICAWERRSSALIYQIKGVRVKESAEGKWSNPKKGGYRRCRKTSLTSSL